MCSPLPPCAWLRSVLRRSPRALRGIPSDVPRPIVRPIGDPLLRFSLLQGSVRVALPASTGASRGSPGPRASAHFQRGAREPSPADDFMREELARALAACRRLLPKGLPAVGDGRLRATSLALFVHAAEVACAWRSRVCFAVGGRFLFRSRDPFSRSLVRRRTARQKPP